MAKGTEIDTMNIKLEVGKQYGDFVITGIKTYDDETKRHNYYYPFGTTDVYYRLATSSAICVTTRHRFLTLFAKLVPITEPKEIK